ncbi:MAG TPA: hypothetical protein VKS22_04945 [Candidatus Binataceae bacterium]|nr:hypothetical protein [Candidatus Binataceae bacterium]
MAYSNEAACREFAANVFNGIKFAGFLLYWKVRSLTVEHESRTVASLNFGFQLSSES